MQETESGHDNTHVGLCLDCTLIDFVLANTCRKLAYGAVLRTLNACLDQARAATAGPSKMSAWLQQQVAWS
jgi:hypothetical protein